MGGATEWIASIPAPIWAIVYGRLSERCSAALWPTPTLETWPGSEFHEQRLVLYAEFIETAYRLRSLVPRLPLGTDEESNVGRRNKESETSERLTNLRDSIFLLGMQEVNLAADTVLGSYWELWMARKTKDTAEQKKKYEIYGEKLEELKLVTRKELEPEI
jgi:hypothetical protein